MHTLDTHIHKTLSKLCNKESTKLLSWKKAFIQRKKQKIYRCEMFWNIKVQNLLLSSRNIFISDRDEVF